MKATEQYFPVVLFIMLYKVILTFESVYEILKCDLSNESYWTVLSCGAVCYAVQGGSTFWVCVWNPNVWQGPIHQYWWAPACDYLNKSYWAVLSCGVAYYTVQGGSNFWVCVWNPKSVNIQMKAYEQYIPVTLFITFESVDKIFFFFRFNILKHEILEIIILWNRCPEDCKG